MTSVRAARVFNGDRWLGPTVIRWEGSLITAVEPDPRDADVDHEVELVIPGLVDAAVRAVGYAERPGGRPFAPEEAFGLLSLRHGVTTIVDVGNGAEVLAHLRRQAAVQEAPNIVGAGARLVEVAAQRTDRVVSSPGLPAAFRRMEAEGVTVVSIGALEHRLRVALGRGAAERDMTVVAPFDDVQVPGLVATMPDGRQADIPQLEAAHRWTVDGLLDAHDAADATPFLPYSRHFRPRGGRMGRRMARGVLSGLYGDRPRVDVDARRRAAERSLPARCCLASSGAGAPGLVPGGSLWAELATFEALSSTADALASATGTAADVFGGVTAGRLSPGRTADLLFVGVPPTTDPPSIQTIAGHLETVVSGGFPIDVRQLRERTDAIVRVALQEVS